MTWLNAGVALLGGFAVTLAAAAAVPLEGAWGGDRMRLVVDATGATLETDCASGRITGPIALTSQGSFSAAGRFESHQGGPQHADASARSVAASYTGEVKGDVMTISITPESSVPAQTFTLRKGAKVKLVRCL